MNRDFVVPWVATLALVLAVGARTSVLAQAEVVTTVEKVTFSVLDAPPCLGEEVLVSGANNVVNHSTLTPSGHFHVKFHANDQNVTAVGQETGTVWRRVGSTDVRDSFTGGAGETHTVTNTFSFIGPHGAPNFLIHQTFHVTINANGTTTTEVTLEKIECK